MPFKKLVGNAERHYSFRELQHPVIEKGLNSVKLDLHKMIVQLEFDFRGRRHSGTGFYINLPSDDYDIILTAGHNLIDEDGTEAKNLIVRGSEDIQHMVSHFKISPRYAAAPGPRSAEFDYGAVLLPKTPSTANQRQGFGFNLGFSSSRNLDGVQEAYVSGYDDKKANLVTSSGPISSARKLLRHKAHTSQGTSGSPIWHGYDGQVVAIGIHTMSPDKDGPGRGTRITEEVFRNICVWSNSGFFSRRLCVSDGKGPKSHNIYLSFPQKSEFAKVFLGSSAAASSVDHLNFDILPVHVSQSSAGNSPLYAFMLHCASTSSHPEKRWLQWQPNHQRAILVDSLKSASLVFIVPCKEGAKNSNLVSTSPSTSKSRNRFSIMLLQKMKDETGVLKQMELRLHDDDRTEHDVEDGMDEFAGVSFGVFKKRNVAEFRTFVFE